AEQRRHRLLVGASRDRCRRDGFHSTREPVFADAVRTAIELGYRLVPYEASFPPPPDVAPESFQAYRSNQQATNLHERIFARDAEAKASRSNPTVRRRRAASLRGHSICKSGTCRRRTTNSGGPTGFCGWAGNP